jgi:hypothetical protein
MKTVIFLYCLGNNDNADIQCRHMGFLPLHDWLIPRMQDLWIRRAGHNGEWGNKETKEISWPS